ncbi:hypothetical protein [Streptomyces sp. NPDC001816]|uniref:hypothetical protein n=1 Tax=Streptomyces sp. NPDC001816 TaxID=3364612 RepID=UPI0036CA913E
MVILEIHGRFPVDADLDAAWKRGLKALHPWQGVRQGSGRWRNRRCGRGRDWVVAAPRSTS